MPPPTPRPSFAQLHIPKGPSSTLRMSPLPSEVSSPNYRGNPFLRSNLSALIPPGKNCSLFIRKLPPNMTTHQLLSAIRGCGRIYSSYINPPFTFPDQTKVHETSAAKIVFFTRSGAETFYHRFGAQGFQIGSFCGTVLWNRVMVAEQHGLDETCSRVVVVSGSNWLVAREKLEQKIRDVCFYDLDEVLVHEADGVRTVEFRFGSYQAQAEAVFKVLGREYRDVDGVEVRFGRDPCE
ncbi:hypothetical protein B0H66DRAFT_584564 [Apodospora peruviana]|uniref:RRM domain-containing protein n=1 Tax=Apodospora peruviana TaxID=516989 RepID=A0AAE0M0E2_9PEZI|nr:hypothetical protein B0H66DRAFT_584564 [Apodospora peruviana]